MRCTWLAENTGRKKSPSEHHRTNLSGCIFATKARIDIRKKKLLKGNSSATCSHNMANFGPLTAEIGSEVWVTPANFNGFRVLASLLQGRRSPDANQTLHDVWPSSRMLHYIYIFGGSCPITEFLPVAKCTLRPSLAFLLYWQRYCTALQQWASAKLCGVVQEMEIRNFRRGRHLYSAGRPSR